jgi:hypothetical protein
MLRLFQFPRRRPSTCQHARTQSAVFGIERLERRALFSTFTVQNLADSGGGSLREAILGANATPGADAVGFAGGLTGTIALTTGQLNITDHLTIDGPGAEQLAVSGSQLGRVFRISGPVGVCIAGLTITDARAVGASADGGGILNSGGTLTLDRVTLSHNNVVGTGSGQARGGAVANVLGATLTVIDSMFTENRALGGAGGGGNGGGIFNLSSTLTVTGSTFAHNQAVGGGNGGAALGGGVTSTTGATATITDCTFVGNQAVAGNDGTGEGFGRGGGVVNFGSTMTVANSLILDNLAQGGSGLIRPGPRVGFASAGGIFNTNGATLLLSGSTVSGNHAVGGSGNTCTGGNGFIGNAQGGGLTNVGTSTITDSLFEENQARGGNDNRGDGVGHQFVGTGFGGGIATTAGDPTGNPCQLTLQNVTVRHNRAVGGNGNTAGTFVNAGIGGGIASNGSNNNTLLSSGCTVTLENSTVSKNHAVGGDGGDGLGGAIANVLGGVFNIARSTMDRNHAQGGDVVAAVSGGNGLGGGIHNGAASTHSSNLGVPTVLTVQQSSLTQNKAQAGADASGGSDGLGVGGGVYNLGQLAVGPLTLIGKNQATASDDDLFGLSI